VDEDAAKLAMEIMREDYGNPSSLHAMGFAAKKRLVVARTQVAALLDCKPDEKTLVFTSGGTEANNLAILGGAQAQKRRGNHIVSAATEHPSVLAALKELQRRDFEVTTVPPSRDGMPTPEAIAAAVTDKTILVTCMLINGETGAMTDVDEMASLIRRRNTLCLIHCDAVQAFGKHPISARKLGADLLTVSAHKLHAPKGCGALYIGKRIVPTVFGGAQENALRPGTESLPLICAFGQAAETAQRNMTEHLAHIRELCEYFDKKAAEMSTICINSPPSGTPYIRNISMPGIKSAHLINQLSGERICVSGGSACSGGTRSYVLEAMSLDAGRIDSAIRVSFSKYTTIDEIDILFEALQRAGDRWGSTPYPA
jgi:cysteine desulfurase